MQRKILDAAAIEQALSGLEGWRADDGHLKRRFEFANFGESLAFVNEVGELAENADHHPDITFGWGYAEFAVTTHDRGGITDVDVALATQINNSYVP